MRQLLPFLLFGPLLGGCASKVVVDCSPPYDPNARKISAVVEAKRIADRSVEIVDGKWDGTTPDEVKNHKYVESPAELNALSQHVYVPGAGPGAMAIGSVGAYYLLNAIGPKLECGEVQETEDKTVYEYDTISTQGTKYRVWSHYPGFVEGQCVTIFFSDKPDQFTPRLASGSDCKTGT